MSMEWLSQGWLTIRNLFALILLMLNIIAYELFWISTEELRIIFIVYSLVACFLIYPTKKGAAWGWVIDLLLIALTLYSTAVLLFDYVGIFDRSGLPTGQDILIGIIGSIVVLEATRRSAGLALTIVALLFILYPMYLGGILSGILAIPTYGIDRVTTAIWLSLNGVFGIPLGVMIQYVFLFVAFGELLGAFGATQTFVDLAKSITGGLRGGSAKICIVASALIGMISGSAVANVMIAGIITIPMMKKDGISPKFAAAVESVGSTGGQLLPPIMGAAAFIMAEFLRVPYLTVCMWAAVPAILYYLSLFLVVDQEATRKALGVLTGEEIPKFSLVLKEKGLFLLPIVLLGGSLFYGFSPNSAAQYAILSLLVVTAIQPTTRKKLTYANISSALRRSAENSVSLFVASGAAGIVVGMVGLTGVGLKIGALIVTLSAHMIILALIFTAIVAIILGMGLPTTIIYIMLSVLIAPALIDLGMVAPAAHLFIFYFGMLSMITPPVCFAVFAAARIAGTDMWETGWLAVRVGAPVFFIPFLFSYNPGMLLIGSPSQIAIGVISGIISVICVSLAVYGYADMRDPKKLFSIPRNRLLVRGLLMGVAVAMVPNDIRWNGLGLLVFLALTSDVIFDKLRGYLQKHVIF